MANTALPVSAYRNRTPLAFIASRPVSVIVFGFEVGMCTVAVVLGGISIFSVNFLPFIRQSLVILPWIDSYVAFAYFRPPAGFGWILILLKPGPSVSIPATVLKSHLPTEPNA